MGNPHYKNILEDKDFKQRCLEADPEGYKILFPEEEIDLTELEINSQKTTDGLDLSDLQINSQSEQEDADNENTKVEDEEKEYRTLDPIARSQFNYNRETCFAENHPEIH